MVAGRRLLRHLWKRVAYVAVLYFCYFSVHTMFVQLTRGTVKVENSPEKVRYHTETTVVHVSKSNRSTMMAKRHASLKERCQQLYGDQHQLLSSSNFKRDHLIFNDKYKLVYCFVPKVACTNLLRVFVMLTGQVQATDPMQLQYGDVHSSTLRHHLGFLSDVNNETEVMHRLKNYKKVIFVRDPFERLLSGWRNKLGPTGELNYKTVYGRYIVKNFRVNASKESIENGDDVLFKEFVQYVIDDVDKKKELDEHWKKYIDLCDPCAIDYDFIGNFDTLDEDMDTLLEDIGVGSFIRFPKRNETYNETKTAEVLTRFYKDVPKELVNRIKDIYFEDSFLFDFKLPTIIQSFD